MTLFLFTLFLVKLCFAQRQLEVVRQDPFNFVIKSSGEREGDNNYNSTLFYSFDIANGIPQLRVNGTTRLNSTSKNEVEYRLQLNKVREMIGSSSSSSQNNTVYDFSGKQSFWSNISLQNRTASSGNGDEAILYYLSAQLKDSSFSNNSNMPWMVNVSIFISNRNEVIIPEWSNNAINSTSASFIPYFINFPYANRSNNLQIEESILTPSLNSLALGGSSDSSNNKANGNSSNAPRGFLAINETVIADGKGAGLAISASSNSSVSNNSTGNSAQNLKLVLTVSDAAGARNISFFEQLGIDLKALAQFNNSGNGNNSSSPPPPSNSGGMGMAAASNILKLGWMIVALMGGLMTVII